MASASLVLEPAEHWAGHSLFPLAGRGMVWAQRFWHLLSSMRAMAGACISPNTDTSRPHWCLTGWLNRALQTCCDSIFVLTVPTSPHRNPAQLFILRRSSEHEGSEFVTDRKMHG